MSNENENLKDLVLFIDDDEFCHKLTQIIVSHFTKYKLISAFSGQEALEMLTKYADRIVLVISDIMLPGMNGYTIYKRAAKNTQLADVPFIFQSGLINQEQKIKKHTNKNCKILYKPYTKEALLEAIHETIAANKF